MNIQTKLTSAIATGALILSMATPALAADDITISGNGAASLNTATVNSTDTTVVTQSNNAYVSNNVSSNADSGGNSANFNTGGSTTVVSGAAQSSTNVTTAANLNSASVDPCNCQPGGAGDVTISGNGATSYNQATLNNASSTTLGQSNTAKVSNNVSGNATSGNNSASFNTGGDTVVSSGPAKSDVNVLTAANANLATIGGGTPGAGSALGSSALITGNGAGSVNTITLSLHPSVVLAQSNSAKIRNNVSSNANSGNNSANFNTGGETVAASGLAWANASVHNFANFNVADLDCGCLTGGVNAKIAGDGATSFGTIKVDNAKLNVLGQSNGAWLKNNVAANGASGYNGAAFNTGAVNSDPVAAAGSALSGTTVHNMVNWNSANQGTTLPLPGGTNLNLILSFSSLLGALHLI